MEKDLIYKIGGSDYSEYFQLFFEINGVRSESFAIYKKEEIQSKFNMTDEEFEAKTQKPV